MKNKKILIWGSVVAVLGGLGALYVYKNKPEVWNKVFQKKQVQNNDNKKEQQQQKDQIELVEDRNESQKSFVTPQPRDDQPLIDTSSLNKDLTVSRPNYFKTIFSGEKNQALDSEQFLIDYLLLLKENLFLAFQEIFIFTNDISPQFQKISEKQKKYSLLKAIEIPEFQLFFDEMRYEQTEVKNFQRVKYYVLRVQTYLRRGIKNTLSQLGLEIEKVESNENVQKINQNLKEQYNKSYQIKQLIGDISKELNFSIQSQKIENNLELDIPQLSSDDFFQMMKQTRKLQCFEIQRTFLNNPRLNHLKGEIQTQDYQVQLLIAELDFSEIIKTEFAKYNLNIPEYYDIIKFQSYLEDYYLEKDQDLKKKYNKLNKIFSFGFDTGIYSPEAPQMIEELFSQI